MKVRLITSTANAAARTLARAERALSLIEIMVTVALLSVIILGLVAMFDQTRKAFASGLNQVDVLEAGRSAMDMIVREIEQMTPAYQGASGDNFYASVDPSYTSLVQPLTDPNESRTNALGAFYFVTKSNLQWYGIGYKVDPAQIPNRIGTLYRYSRVITNYTGNQGSFFVTSQTLDTNYSRVIDGVVTLKIRAYDRNGILAFPGGGDSFQIFTVSGERGWRFYDDAVPGYVEVELAILETRTLERWRSLTNTLDKTAALSFLAKHAGQVHVFRQRVPIRAMDPNAF